jgi:hypothetical protein
MSALSDIQARKTGFYFRKAIPSELRHHFGGKREIVRSLGKDPAKARVKGRELSLHLERLIIAIREGGINAPVSNWGIMGSNPAPA